MELQHLGWNVLTLSLIMTIIFNFVAAWGLWGQAKNINATNKGGSVSGELMIYFCGLYVATLAYAHSRASIALWANGIVRGVMHVPVIWQIVKYRGLSRREALIGLLVVKYRGLSRREALIGLLAFAGSIFSVTTPRPELSYFAFSIGALGFVWHQPYVMYIKKSRKAVSLKLYIIYLFSTTFWLAYSFTAGDPMLKIFCPIYFVATITTLFLWFKYPETDP